MQSNKEIDALLDKAIAANEDDKRDAIAAFLSASEKRLQIERSKLVQQYHERVLASHSRLVRLHWLMGIAMSLLFLVSCIVYAL